MSTPISAYGPGRLSGYGPLKPASAPADARPSAPAEEAQNAAAPTAPDASGLSRDEQQLIQRYFPASDALSMRIYGPGNSAREIRPQAVGSRLDLRG